VWFRPSWQPQNLENALAHVVLEVADDGLFRTPAVTDSTGGAISEKQARDRGRMLKVADQAVTLAFENGLPVSESIASSLLPTPTTIDGKSVDVANQVATRNSLQLQSITAILGMPEETWESTDLSGNKDRQNGEGARRRELLPTVTAQAAKHSADDRGLGSVDDSNLWAVAGRLLPTPNTMEHREIKTPEQIAELKERSPGGYRNLRETVVNEIQTLPTPQVDDSKNTGHNTKRRPTLASATYEISNEVKLFPTLRASDSYERRNQKTMDRIAKDGGDMTMTTLARTTTDWGKYEPAIRRWEAILGRQSPDPTNPDGRDGAHRLSSRFTEWMMGLPEGWITSHGLSREKELKLAGNGVVPQQAAIALTKLLEGINLDD